MTGTKAVPEQVEASATRSFTPCGSGDLVWRRWGSGPPVVLLHGGYGSWTHWVRNIEVLAASHDVLVPDLPGLGDSALPPEPYDASSIAAVLEAGMDRLVASTERMDLVGFSFGGLLAGVIAARQDERIRSLTLIGPSGLSRMRPPVDLLSWRRSEPGRRRAVHEHNLATLMLAQPDSIDSSAIDIQATNAERARLRSRPIARTPVLAEALPHVVASIAVIYGAEDPSVRDMLPARIRELRGLRPDIDVHIVPGAGHWVAYEEAALVNDILLERLAGRDDP